MAWKDDCEMNQKREMAKKSDCMVQHGYLWYLKEVVTKGVDPITRYISEFISSFLLAFLVVSYSVSLLRVKNSDVSPIFQSVFSLNSGFFAPIVYGFAVAVIAWAFGPYSADMNLSVTIAKFTAGMYDIWPALYLFVIQFIGWTLGAFLVCLRYSQSDIEDILPATGTDASNGDAFVYEFFCTLVIVMVAMTIRDIPITGSF